MSNYVDFSSTRLSLQAAISEINELKLQVVPLKDKVPVLKGWGGKNGKIWQRQIDNLEVAKWNNVGAVTGTKDGILVIDLDIPNGLVNMDRWWKPSFGHSILDEETRIVETPSGGYHVYFRYSPILDVVSTTLTELFGLRGVDMRGKGGYICWSGSMYNRRMCNKGKYHKCGGDDSNCKFHGKKYVTIKDNNIMEIPPDLCEQMMSFYSKKKTPVVRDSCYDIAHNEHSFRELLELFPLSFFDEGKTWRPFITYCANHNGSSVAHHFSSLSSKYNEEEVNLILDKGTPCVSCNGIDWYFDYILRTTDIKGAKSILEKIKGKRVFSREEGIMLFGSDDTVCDYVYKLHKRDIYSLERDSYIWNINTLLWEKVSGDEIERFITPWIRNAWFNSKCNNQKRKGKLLSHSFTTASGKKLRIKSINPLKFAAMNNHKSLLPVFGGFVIDLKTSQMRKRSHKDLFDFECKYRPSQLYTDEKFNTEYDNPDFSASDSSDNDSSDSDSSDNDSSTSNNPNCKKDLFREWILSYNDDYCSDDEYFNFIQLWLGYLITGEVKEKLFFVLYGTGDNGKSTFMNQILKVFGKLCGTANWDSFSNKTLDKNDGLMDALMNRIVNIQEIPENLKGIGSSHIIKSVTGGDIIKGNRKYEKDRSYNPICKIVVSSNHILQLNTADTAILSRIIYLPFLKKFTSSKANDKKIDSYLQLNEELMTFAINGAKRWYNGERIKNSNPFTEHQKAFISEGDSYSLFIKDCLITDEHNIVEVKQIFELYREWCQDQDMKPQSRKGLSILLGGEKKRKATRCYVGFKLVDEKTKFDTDCDAE